MYKVKTTLLASHDKDQKIGDKVYKNLITAGCPKSWFQKVDPDIEINGTKFVGLEDEDLVFECGEIIETDQFDILVSFIRVYDLTIMREGEDITTQIKQIAHYYEDCN